MARPDTDAKSSSRLHRNEAANVVREEEQEAEAPLFAESVRLPGSNAERAAMAARARAGGADGGAALDGNAAAAADRAGMGDVSGVRVHTGGAAAQAAAAVQAKAFTVGKDIYFGAGQFQPGTAGGDQLIGHELAHAAQQRGAAPEMQAKLDVSQTGDASESEADVAGGAFARAARGDAVAPAPITATAAHIAREPLTSPAPTAVEDEEILSDAKARAAVTFNRGRHLPADAWAKVAAVVGAPGPDIDVAMARQVAKFQKAQGFDFDGRVGDMTLQRISQQPGGAGLEDLVKNDNILYLGLNPGSRSDELGQLQGAGANVTGITGARTQDTAKVGNQTVDLNDPTGLDAYLAQYPKLDAGRQQALRDFFDSAGGSSKDELAMLAKYLYEAEFGKRLFKRIVLSGHSGGWSIWGDDNGSLSFDHLARLATIFPGAVGQVEDLMLSACNTGQKDKLDQYTKIFPHLKSIWAYVGYSPSAATGSLRHIKEWEKATRGTADTDKIDAGREKVGQGSGDKDDNVAIWANETGAASPTYKTNSPEANLDFATLKATVDTGLAAYNAAFDQGTIDQTALNELYTQLQALVGQFGSQLGDQRDTYDKVMRRTLNLRHWSNVLKHFMVDHGAELKSVWADLPRDFGTASRSKVLAYLAGYTGNHANAAYVQAVSMLQNLENIPENWN